MIYLLKPQLVKKPWGIRDVWLHTGIIPPGNFDYGEIWVGSGNATKLRPGQDGAGPTRIIGTDSDLNKLCSPAFLGDIPPTSGAMGKAESWYFRKVQGRVEIVAGLKDHITKEGFHNLVHNGYFMKNPTYEDMKEHMLKTRVVNTGDAFTIMPGTVHTIVPDPGAFAVVDEVQQGFGENPLPTLSKILLVKDILSLQVHPSDKDVETAKDDLKQVFLAEPTLRIYDWGRDRDCRASEAADCIVFGKDTCIQAKPIRTEHGSYSITAIFRTAFFSKDLIEIYGQASLKHKGHYYIYQVIQGTVEIDGELHSKGTVFATGADLKILHIISKGAVLLRDYIEKHA